MKNPENSKVSRGLLGEGLAAEFGMPQRFDLPTKLSESSHIRLATAFAHHSGWEFIGRNVLTKILAAHDGKRWPVYNAKVEGVLGKYGYEIPRGLTEAQKCVPNAKIR